MPEPSLSARLWAAGWGVAVDPAPEGSSSSAGEAGGGLCGPVSDPQAALRDARAVLGGGGGFGLLNVKPIVANQALTRGEPWRPECPLAGGGGNVGGGGEEWCAEEEGADGGAIRFTVAVQYIRRPKVARALAAALRRTATRAGQGVEFILNNDGGTGSAMWAELLKGLDHTIVHSPNLHEIRAYNRLAKLARGEFVAFLQDDDVPRDPGWLSQAASLFEAHPKMGLLGGYCGRLDVGEVFDVRSGQASGAKFGPGQRKLTHVCPTTGLPFMFVYKANAAPLVVRRGAFLALGGFDRRLSCSGGAGIGFDFEFSVRLWFHGHQVGLYYAQFQHQAGDAHRTGTRADANKFALRRMRERDNNLALYELYPGMHHAEGTRVTSEALLALTPATGRAAYDERKFVRKGDFEGCSTCREPGS